MLLNILLKLLKLSFGNKILDIVNGINERLSGYRSELIIFLEVILFLGRKFGIIPHDQVELVKQLMVGLLGALPVTLVEKVGKAIEIGDKLTPNN